MTKAEEFIIKSIENNGSGEYVTKESALLAVKIEHDEMEKRFNDIFRNGCGAEVSMSFDSYEGTRMMINIRTKG